MNSKGSFMDSVFDSPVEITAIAK